MNKRIQELKDMCYIPIAERVDDTEYDMEKFANLIVRWCGTFTDPVTRNLMMIYFGVEE